MIRMVLIFLILFAVFYFGLPAVRNLNGKERWQLTKLIAYSILCAVLTTVTLIAIVIAF